MNEDDFRMDSTPEFQYDTHQDVYNDSSHPAYILQRLNEQRRKELFTDAIVMVDQKRWPCHRAVLAAVSDFFSTMFLSEFLEKEGHVEMKGVDDDIFELIIEFAYTSKVRLSNQNAAPLLAAADMLQVVRLRDKCQMFLEKEINVNNCFHLLEVAKLYAIPSLLQKAHECMVLNFSTFCNEEDFLKLQKDDLINLLRYEQLNVDSEFTVFESVVRWLLVSEDHEADKEEVMQWVRFPMIPEHQFLMDVEGSEHLETPMCLELLKEARWFHMEPSSRQEMVSHRTRPRPSTGSIEVLAIVGNVGKREKFTVCFYDPSKSMWRFPKIKFHGSRTRGAVAGYNNNIYISGGSISGGVSKDVLMYNMDRDSLQKLPSMKEYRVLHRMIPFDGHMYCIGGKRDLTDANRLASVERFSFHTRKWELVTPLIHAASTPAVAVCRNALYVMGGRGARDTNLDCIQILDRGSQKWRLGSRLPRPRAGACAVVFHGLIYVAGDQSTIVDVYDPIKDTWAEVHGISHSHNSGAMAIYNEKIIIGGGSVQSKLLTNADLLYNRLDLIEALDPRTGEWEHHGHLPRPALSFGMLTVHKKCSEDGTLIFACPEEISVLVEAVVEKNSDSSDSDISHNIYWSDVSDSDSN